MTCITRIRGYGGNCATGTSNNQLYNLTYPGICTVAQTPGCAGGLVSPRYPDGTIYSAHYFSSVISLTYEGCDNSPPPDQPYDCLNGGCVPKTTYNTPGVFATLAACQSGCAKNSDCVGECVSTGELAALQQAANNLQTKFCK